MEIIFEERIDQALRHLQPQDLRKTIRILEKLKGSTFDNLKQDNKIKKISLPTGNIFVIKINEKLRLIYKYGENRNIILEDIVSHDILEKFFQRKSS